MPKPAPAADRQAMVDAYLSGLSHEEAGKKFGYSSMAVRRELKRRGIASRLHRISREQRGRVKALYAERVGEGTLRREGANASHPGDYRRHALAHPQGRGAKPPPPDIPA